MTGDGVTDDTAAINLAISQGSRCAPGVPGVGCQSSTTAPAVVYFPTGTYLVSSPIILYYMTNLVGNFHSMPTLKASANFPTSNGAISSIIDADPYTSANPTYATTNVFYRQIRNLVFDTTSVPAGSLMRGIHWPTAQATSLQNLVFKMSTASGNQHVGVFIENGEYSSFIWKERCSSYDRIWWLLDRPCLLWRQSRNECGIPAIYLSQSDLL